MTEVRPDDWQHLQSQLVGTVLLPGDAGWNTARTPKMRRFADIRPMALVRCADFHDVSKTLTFLREYGLRFAVRSGGHDFAGHSTSTGVVLDLSAINQISLTDGQVQVGAGAQLGQVYRSLEASAQTLPGGCGATVGVAGLTLGGGFGVLGRRLGLLCDRLREATVVLADGTAVTCADAKDSDLFWALHGAGHGHFGVVTELVYEAVPAPACVVFEAQWDAESAPKVLGCWQWWAPEQSNRLAASLLLNTSADPGTPLQTTILGAAHDLDGEETRRLLHGFQSEVGAQPRLLQLRELSWSDAKDFVAQRAPGHAAGAIYSKSEFHEATLSSSAVEDLINRMQAGRVVGESRELDFSPWGGAYNAPSRTATAFPHRNGRFLLKHAATISPQSPAADREASPWLTESWEFTHPFGTGGVYPNFPDDDLAEPAYAYFGSNLARLRRIKDSYDPDQFFSPLGGERPS